MRWHRYHHSIYRHLPQNLAAERKPKVHADACLRVRTTAYGHTDILHSAPRRVSRSCARSLLELGDCWRYNWGFGTCANGSLDDAVQPTCLFGHIMSVFTVLIHQTIVKFAVLFFVKVHSARGDVWKIPTRNQLL